MSEQEQKSNEHERPETTQEQRDAYNATLRKLTQHGAHGDDVEFDFWPNSSPTGEIVHKEEAFAKPEDKYAPNGKLRSDATMTTQSGELPVGIRLVGDTGIGETGLVAALSVYHDGNARIGGNDTDEYRFFSDGNVERIRHLSEPVEGNPLFRDTDDYSEGFLGADEIEKLGIEIETIR